MGKRNLFERAGILLLLQFLALSLAANEAKLESGDKATGDAFGTSVSLSGATLLVGAPSKQSSTGAAYIFQNASGAWAQSAKLNGADSAPNDKFGTAAGVAGDYAVVGASGNDNGKGAAYIFQSISGTWTQTAKLVASDAANNAKLGAAAAISGTYAVVGAPGDDGSKGAAYVFANSGDAWSQSAKLAASDGAGSASFGSSICMLGSYALLGAPGDNSSRGAVYVFKNNSGTWIQEAKLLASDATANSLFGSAIAMSGSYAAIGAPGAASGNGAVYVFQVSGGGTWTQQGKLTASDGANGDALGSSVALDGSIVVAGAPNAASLAGKIYAFNYKANAWNETKLSYSSVSGKIGASLAALSSKLYMGAPAYSSNQGAIDVADYTLNDTSLLFSFNGTSTSFNGTVSSDSSSAQSCSASVANSAGTSLEYLGGYENLSIDYASSTSANAKISGVNVDWGKKFVLEAKIYKGDEAAGVIELVKNANNNTLRWYIDTDGKMKLTLNGGSNFNVSSANAVLTNKTWTKLYAVVDLTQTAVANAVKFYAIPDGSAGASSNYFGTGADGERTISVDNSAGDEWDSGASGEMIVKNFTNFTVNSGVTLTIRARKGCMIYATGNVNIQGTIRVLDYYSCDPVAAGVSATGLRIVRFKDGSTDTLSSSDISGSGSTAIAAEANQAGIFGNGKIYTIPRGGANGAGAIYGGTWGNGAAGYSGGTLQTGGGGSGGQSGSGCSGAGAAGTCFGGGAGGGGAYAATANAASANASAGGAGGSTYANVNAGGGAGNPGGVGAGNYGRTGDRGTGGLLLLFVKGSISLASNASIDLRGTSGGGLPCAGDANIGGGSSGGGAALILYGGTSSNPVTVNCAGGPIVLTSSACGGAGGAGSYLIEQIPLSIPFAGLAAGSTYNQSAFTNGLTSADTSIELMQRSGAFTLKSDFIKISAKANLDSFSTSVLTDWSGSSASGNYVASGSSSSIIVSPTSMLRRVVNPPSDFTDGVLNPGKTAAYDQHPTVPSVFYGVFEVNVKLDSTQFNGAVWVDFFIQKPEDSSFKKIGQIQTSKPSSGDWNVTLYWNSRAAAYGWTAADAQPYRTDGPVRFKFSVR